MPTQHVPMDENLLVLPVPHDGSDAADSDLLGPAGSTRRLCQSCNRIEATRGIASPDGNWKTLFCRICAKKLPGHQTTGLRLRCRLCTRHATFGPSGAPRAAARHCQQHRLRDEANLVKVVRQRCVSHEADGSCCTHEAQFCKAGENVPLFCRHHRPLLHIRPPDPLPLKDCSPPSQSSTAGFRLLVQPNKQRTPLLCAPLATEAAMELAEAEAELSRRCEHHGCKNRPSYGSVSDCVARYCRQVSALTEAKSKHVQECFC